MTHGRAVGFALVTSFGKWILPVGTLAGILQFLHNGYPDGEWDDGLRAAVNCSVYAALGIAGAAAIDARRYRRAVPSLMTSARGVSAVIVPVLAVATWGGLTVLALSGFSIIGNLVSVPFRMPNLCIIVAGLSWMIETAAFGWLAGYYGGYIVGIPLSLLVVWLGNAVLAIDTGGYGALFSGIDDGVFFAGYNPVTAVLLVRALIAVALAAVFVSIAAVRIMPPRQLVVAAAVVVLCVATAASLVVRSGTAPAVAGFSANSPRVCSTEDVMVCGWPDHDVTRRRIAAMAPEMWSLLRKNGVSLPLGLIDEGMALPSGWQVVSMRDGDAFTSMMVLADATLRWMWCGPGETKLTGDPGTVIQREFWLVSQVGRLPEGALSHETLAIMRLDDNAQVKWLIQRPVAVRCVR